jgi:anaerobic selenocysteine-containing dehydrogenase
MGESTLHLRSCHLCEAMCGIEVRVDDDQITRIRANQDDVWSKGHLCPKGASLGRLHHDPDRLRTPLVRDADGVLQPASWEDAFARSEEILHGRCARATRWDGVRR